MTPYVDAPDSEVMTLMLLSVPSPLSLEEVMYGVPTRGHIQVIKELRSLFGFQLGPTVAMVRCEMPVAVATDLKSVLEPKAEKLREWGCEVELVPLP